jgi:hypothetical protein
MVVPEFEGRSAPARAETSSPRARPTRGELLPAHPPGTPAVLYRQGDVGLALSGPPFDQAWRSTS